ncbi:MAG: type IV toxin-antitoxin system AbiEi family antitoxin domain-containing protein [Ignavibacteria bacterium]|nr:type IV toxin-antitoxin system AbiEi family antitoxin domain-containing protein [Ignavibacteria bacterium]
MNFLQFKEKFFKLSIFTTDQVYAWYSNFDRNNFSRWVKKGLIIRLRQGLYTFPEYKTKPNFDFYAANRIYRPSYISIHSALSFYGLIPEAVFQTTSVSTLKTASFENDFGTFVYKTISAKLMYGYSSKKIAAERYFLIADPEKAIMDLLYLYPEYNSEDEIFELRLDEDILLEIFNKELLTEYTEKTENKSLLQRVQKLITVYGL